MGHITLSGLPGAARCDLTALAASFPPTCEIPLGPRGPLRL
jgi:hypothetical protein